MTFSIGLDIGGTKIAGAVFDAQGALLAQSAVPTPKDYQSLLDACGTMVGELDQACGQKPKIGIGVAGMIDRDKGSVFAPNIPCLEGHAFRSDCEKIFDRAVRLANDADCAALAEAMEGAGQGHRSVFCLIMGTGVGGGFVFDGKMLEGAHGLAGEIGHLPLPFREAEDGPIADCGCGQKGCIDKSISGPALARLYKAMTGKEAHAGQIVDWARQGDSEARRVLDQFYVTVAKATITVIHTFDPDIILVSGGLNALPGLYDKVPNSWGRYSLCKNLRTKFVPAKFGVMSGVRGAARMGR
jgi:fructokinase